MSASRVDPSRWSGGASPYGISWQKQMMWWFIVTDFLLFATFLACYGFARVGVANWPDQTQVFNMNFITAMTFVLITSSATMATAVTAAARQDQKMTRLFLGLTILGGLGFLGMQAVEWSTLIHDGARLETNPWGAAPFGAYFFTITGFHGTHVLIGLIVLVAVAIRSLLGKATPGGLELAGLYWHFVDLVWVFVFGTFYLI